ncbi:MAG: NACHT domain-containing protein [Cyanothece sp. SIO2G6]|nr:NACHT domain-containing protein [Cyanothece sp. SIO2G6]
MPDTLNASTQGLAIANQARLRKGWTKTSTARWWQDAHTSRATLRRFWRGERIQRDAFIAICDAVGISDWQRVAEVTGPKIASTGELCVGSPLVDWGEAPDLGCFWGRSRLLESLMSQITDHQCRFIAITGMAGIGKTALALALADRVQGEVDGVIWRSLSAYSSLTTLLESLLTTVGDQADTLHQQIRRLQAHLQRHRYLIILDGLDTWMPQTADSSGIDSSIDSEINAKNVSDFQTWLMGLAQVSHKSCILVTNRESLPLMATPLAHSTITIPLTGLTPQASEKLLLAAGLAGTSAERKAVGHLYGGNPLAMQLAVPVIQSIFGGNIAAFLRTHTPFVGDRLRLLLNQQLEKLTPMERDIVYWLAIWQEPIPLSRLHTHLFPTPDPMIVLECLVRLEGRSLLDKVFIGDDPAFTLPPLVMESVMVDLVERVTAELLQFLQPKAAPGVELLRTHCLLRPGTDDIAGDRILLRIRTALTNHTGGRVGPVFQALEAWLNPPSNPPPPTIIGYATHNIMALKRVFS